MSNNLDKLTAQLGAPASFVMTPDKRRILQRWAIAFGHEPFKVNGFSNVQLANLYVEQIPPMPTGAGNGAAAPIEAPAPSIETEAAETGAPVNMLVLDAINRLMDAVNVMTEDRCRQIAEEVMANGTGGGVKRLEIITPRATVQLEGHVHAMTEKVIRVAALGHPIMLVGPAGCGKTTIGEHVAKALDLPFLITSTINDTHELTGFIDGYGKYHSTPFRQAFEHGGVWIADEIDAWDAAALLTANAALANGICNFPDCETPVKRHPDFRMIATANTFGHGADRLYVGRNELDAASLDRFCTIDIDYDIELERSFAAGNTEWLEYIWNVRQQVQAKKLRHVISSRAIIMGVQALAAGLDKSDVQEWYVFKGLSKTDRSKLS